MQNVPKMSPFHWTPKKGKAACLLAEGKSIDIVAQKVGVSEKTIDRWKKDNEFTQEVNRLSLMVDIASRAERVRIAMRAVRAKVEGEKVDTDKDLLDWLKYVQSETDGIKLDLYSDLVAIIEESGQPPV
jgi:transposase-like protein